MDTTGIEEVVVEVVDEKIIIEVVGGDGDAKREIVAEVVEETVIVGVVEGEGETSRDVTVTLNKRPVTFHQREVKGAGVKEEAIKQGVPIEQDFVLFKVKGTALDQIGDDQTIKIHENEEFRATAPDDHS